MAWLVVPVALVAVLGAVLTGLHDKPATRGSLETQRIAQAALERIGAPVPAPTPAATPVVQAPEVRRAELVPVLRAQQVLRVGRWNQVYMPDGRLTWMRFLGVKDTFADLPRDPQIGDAWGIVEGGRHALWVWHILPGHSRPAWVDLLKRLPRIRQKRPVLRRKTAKNLPVPERDKFKGEPAHA
jgi:hypothetical protein